MVSYYVTKGTGFVLKTEKLDTDLTAEMLQRLGKFLTYDLKKKQ